MFLVTLCVATAISNVISKKNKREADLYSNHLEELNDQYSHNKRIMNEYKNTIDSTKKIIDNFDNKK